MTPLDAELLCFAKNRLRRGGHSPFVPKTSQKGTVSDGSHIGRREFLVCGGLLFLAGCAGPAVRSQSPEDAEMASIEKQVRLVESVAVPFGMNYVRAEGPALVVGLKNTGSDPPPNAQRAELLADMQARGVVNPNTVLASPSTSLVWVVAYLPPGAKGGSARYRGWRSRAKRHDEPLGRLADGDAAQREGHADGQPRSRWPRAGHR